MFAMIAGAVAMALQPSAKTWFGPVVVTFNVQYPGNPFDPAQNDLRVRFRDDKGQTTERLAYFDSGASSWKAVFVADHPGTYRAVLVRNGVDQAEAASGGQVSVDKALPHGFVRLDPAHVNRFVWDDGTAYVPIGCNLAWQEPNILPLEGELAKLGAAKATWSRIWAATWDGKNPWWPDGKNKAPEGWLWAPALDKWSKLFTAAESAGISFQMVLHNHGSFSSRVDSNWGDNPWNTAKGGFLKDAADFFTNPEAKRRTKMWLRYAIARYAASPSLLAWELFNEVQWTDARYADRWQDIADWHKEMAGYIRSLDPYHHLVTTSSEIEQKLLWTAMDYYQPHTYPADIFGNILNSPLPTDKPAFYGEFGPTDLSPDGARRFVRDGLFAGLLANHAGGGMYWSWDVVEKQNLYDEFEKATRAVQLSGWAGRATAKRAPLGVHTAGHGDLVFAPGMSWGSSTQKSFSLPADAQNGAMAKLSSYFQGTNHGDMNNGPTAFHVSMPSAGEFSIAVREVSKAGAKLFLNVDGVQTPATFFPASAANSQYVITIKVAIPAGKHVVTIENTGADWFTVTSITVTGIAQQVRATALAEIDWLFARLTGVAGAETQISGLPLAEGIYDRTWLDLDTGVETKDSVTLTNFALPTFKMPGKDLILILNRR